MNVTASRIASQPLERTASHLSLPDRIVLAVAHAQVVAAPYGERMLMERMSERIAWHVRAAAVSVAAEKMDA